MAQLTCDFFSETLMVGTSMTVVLPQRTEEQIGVAVKPIRDTDFPVLYLLHGLSDDHTAWTRYTSIARYGAEAGLAVVMPAVHRSFYTDEVHGHRYWSFVSEELPSIVGRFFAVSQAPEDTFVAGLSMGGFGAMKLALSHPDRFAAAASLSGVLDIGFLNDPDDPRQLLDRVFGGRTRPEDDLFPKLAALDPATAPALFVGCGTEEPMLLPGNDRFIAEAEALGLNVTKDYRPGTHEWGLWDDVIQDVIDWLPIRP